MPIEDQKTRRVLARYAAEKRCLSYLILAKELGLDPPHHWTQPVASHLRRLIKEARQAGEPCLSAIVVGKDDLKRYAGSGPVDMAQKRLESFVDSAAEAGYDVGADPLRFLRQQQQAVFDWGKRVHK